VLRRDSFEGLGCALLRTIDGAQDAVIVRRTFAVMAGGFTGGGAFADQQALELAARLLPDLQLATHVGWTLLVVGALVALSQYFRSQLAQKLFTAGDPAPP
jgi:hypothetical protein